MSSRRLSCHLSAPLVSLGLMALSLAVSVSPAGAIPAASPAASSTEPAANGAAAPAASHLPGGAAKPNASARHHVDRPPSDDASLPEGATFSTVPKAYVLSLGGAMNYTSALPNRDDAQPGKQSRGLSGVEVMGEWLWQLGGFRSDWPVWLGYYLGWIHLPGDKTSQRTGVLEYGIRVRHGYRISPTVRPFFTYCLGATQVWIDGLPGRGITHQTRTGLGVDLKVARRMRVLLAAEWIRQSLPDLGSTVDRSFSALTFNVGVIFERQAH